MRRADRLFSLITRLRAPGPHKADDLARAEGVSVRTIYRDMETLAASGVPVQGERGSGYWVTAAVTLPALNLSQDEADALLMALTGLAGVDDEPLASPARNLAARLAGLLDETADQSDRRPLAIHPFADSAGGFRFVPRVRQALRARQKLRIRIDGQGDVVWPLHLGFWGRIWTVVCWSESRGQFDELRLDQIEEIRPVAGLFGDEPGRTLEDYRNLKNAN